MDFSKVKSIVIPEGNVTKITDTNNTRTIWQKEDTSNKLYLIKNGKFTENISLIRNSNYVVTENYNLNGTPVVEILYNGSTYDDNDEILYKKTFDTTPEGNWSNTTSGTMAVMVDTSAGGSWSTSSVVYVDGSATTDPNVEPTSSSTYMEIKYKSNYSAVQNQSDETQVVLKDVSFSNYTLKSDFKAIWFDFRYRYVGTPPLGKKVRWFIKDLYRIKNS